MTQIRWIFDVKELENTPSIRNGMSKDEELTNRQIAAGMIRKIGRKLYENCQRPSNLSINTAMVFMHRFYMFHSFQKYSALSIASCVLFVAAKVEETPLKLEYVIKTDYMLRNPKSPNLDIKDERYEQMRKTIIDLENLLLQTLGFDLVVVHPHTSVITCAELAGVPEALTKMAYNLATNSLHFTTMCLRYKPTTVACICIHLASKSATLDIGQSVEGRYWWTYLDSTIDMEEINRITLEFVSIIEKYKKSFNSWMNPDVKRYLGHSHKRIKLDN